MEVISCNNERPHPLRSQRAATIDIRAEAIGRRGRRATVWGMRNREQLERIRIMVEPVLLESGVESTVHHQRATATVSRVRLTQTKCKRDRRP